MISIPKYACNQPTLELSNSRISHCQSSNMTAKCFFFASSSLKGANRMVLLDACVMRINLLIKAPTQKTQQWY